MIQSVLNYGIPLIKWRLTDECNYNCSYCIRDKMKTKDSSNDFGEEDLKNCILAIPYVENIIKELSSRFSSKVKIDLIGGEVSMFDLESFFNNFSTLENIDAINITTNFSRECSYYENLIKYLKDKGVKLTMTASFHYESVSLGEFFEKANIINKSDIEIFKVETVETVENVYVQDFIQKAKGFGIQYMVDLDRRIKKSSGVDYNNKKNPRYHIVEDTISYDLSSRNELLIKYEKNAFPCKGYYCSRDYDYVYIVINEVIGNNFERPERGCKDKFSISKYKLLDTPPLCQRDNCTICGRISLSKDPEVLKNNAVLKEAKI